MILGLLLGIATLAAVSSAFGEDMTEVEDPVGDDGLNVTGSENGDLLEGNQGDDQFFGKGGDDLLIGRSGADGLYGGDHADGVFGGDGDDFLRGGADNDLIIGDDGADNIHGDGGDDRIVSAAILDAPVYQASLLAADDPTGVNVTFDYRTDTDEGDLVDAGTGDDEILFGSHDTVTGGEGADLFASGDWIAAGAPATITDFDSATDVIGYSFDGQSPEITSQLDDDGTATVSADGAAFLVVVNAGPEFDASLIELQRRIT